MAALVYVRVMAVFPSRVLAKNFLDSVERKAVEEAINFKRYSLAAFIGHELLRTPYMFLPGSAL